MRVAQAGSPPSVDRPIVGDAVEPGSETAVEPEARQVAVDQDEYLLRDFLRLRLEPRTEDGNRQTENTILVPAGELSEESGVPGFEELAVGAIASGAYVC